MKINDRMEQLALFSMYAWKGNIDNYNWQDRLEEDIREMRQLEPGNFPYDMDAYINRLKDVYSLYWESLTDYPLDAYDTFAQTPEEDMKQVLHSAGLRWKEKQNLLLEKEAEMEP